MEKSFSEKFKAWWDKNAPENFSFVLIMSETENDTTTMFVQGNCCDDCNLDMVQSAYLSMSKTDKTTIN